MVCPRKSTVESSSTLHTSTKKRFAERAPRRNREPDQIRRAELDQELKAIQSGLEEEQSSVRFNNDYLRNLYQDGEISLREFYSRQRTEIDRGVTAKVEALTNERTAIENALKNTTDQSEMRTALSRSSRTPPTSAA